MSVNAGLLLVGHGSREPVGTAEFLALASRVARRVHHLPVEPCFLEFAEPAITAGFDALARRGVRSVVVVPVLLFAAGHAKRDIPAAVARAAARWPDIAVAQCPHLGCHEAILTLSQRRFKEALTDRTTGARTALVMVGRGSHDAEATAEMRRFVELRAATECCRAWASFVAMAEPNYLDTLDEAAHSGAERIVVQPHLLFGGVLVDRIGRAVTDFAIRYPDRDWLTAAHLGADDLVAQAVLARAAESLPAGCAAVDSAPARSAR